MPASSTTGDIVWRRQDPKTVELYNVNPEAPPEPTPEGSGGGEGLGALTGKGISPQELEDLKSMYASTPSFTEEDTRAQRQQWRRQFRTFDRTLKKGDPRR